MKMKYFPRTFKAAKMNPVFYDIYSYIDMVLKKYILDKFLNRGHFRILSWKVI